MKSVRHPADRRRGQEGQVLALVGICMIAFMAFAMLGVDIGRLAFTGSEDQALVDAAAMSGAQAYITTPVGSATAQAQAVASQNTVDGVAGTAGNGTTNLAIATGCWSSTSRTFSASGAYPPVCGTNDFQAVKATGDSTVTNFIAGMFQHNTSTVHRHAVAIAGGIENGHPAFPVALSECWFKQYLSDKDCSSLDDQIHLVPGSPNSGCYTNLSNGDPTNPNTVLQFLPPTCSSGGHSGQGVAPPLVNIGDDIQLQNGAVSSALQVIQDCFNKGLTDWFVPVIKCDGTCTGVTCSSLNCNQTDQVTGFASLHITAVTPNGKNAGITIQTICKSNLQGQGGGGGPDNGPKAVAMVQ